MRSGRARAAWRATSAARTSASPTSTAWAPAATTRSTSARVVDAALAHRHRARRDAGQQRERGVEARLERLEVAVVHADHRRAEAQRAVELGRGVRLDQRRRAPRPCAAWNRSRRAGAVERGHDQQHRVGAGGARLPELVLVDDELLAEHRARRRRRARRSGRRGCRWKYFASVSTLTAAAPAARVGPACAAGSSARGQHAPGRRGALDLGDAAARARPPDGPERGGEVPRGGKAPARRDELGERPARSRRRQLRALVGDDLVEDAHATIAGATCPERQTAARRTVAAVSARRACSGA